MPVSLPQFSQPPAGHRDWYLFEAVRALPRILLMLDKNPVSPTYGSFDREYWHYRTMDFPCGMNQEFCLALALGWAMDHPQNPFYQNERIRELVLASLRYAAKSGQRDGSCDDYFPYERALGAAVFSLYAMTESYQVLGFQDPTSLEFFARRGGWLLAHNESGRLANHQALAALGLCNVYALTGDNRFKAGLEQFLSRTLSWQHEEGWFQEYEGADPGYHSCSIDFLAKLRQKTGDQRLTAPLLKAVQFAAHFMHPDGSYAGEYGSRNTYHFYPHGFELLARESREALEIAELYLRHGLPRRTRYCNDDNRMCAHYVYDWFQAWRDYADLPGRQQRECLVESKETFFQGAGLFIKRDAGACVVVAGHKGGVIKITNRDGPVYSDTGPLVQFADGKVLVAHLVSPLNQVQWNPESNTLTISGNLCWRRAPVMTPVKQMVFRMVSLTLGRLNPNWLRILIQKLFITGKALTRSTFKRTIRFEAEGVEIADEIQLREVNAPVQAVLAAPDATSIYVANSNTFQATNLLPVRRLDKMLAQLRDTGHGQEIHRVSLHWQRQGQASG